MTSPSWPSAFVAPDLPGPVPGRTLGHRLLRLQPGEGLKVLLFAALGGLLQAGVAIGLSASDGLFLSVVGSERLPLVYMLSLGVMLAYISVYAWLIGRWGVGAALRLTLVVLVVGGLACWGTLTALAGGLGTPLGHMVLYAVKLYALLWFIALYSLFWNLTDSYFDIQDAKRLFPLLAAGGAVGAAAGGALVSWMSVRLGVASLFLVWALLSLVALPLIGLIARRHRPLDAEEEEESGRLGLLAQLAALGRGIRTSRFALIVSVLLFLTLVVTTVCEFQYLAAFSAGRTSAALAELFGRLFLVANLINLLVNLFLFNRMIAWLGVKNTALIQPVVYVVTFAAFFIQHGETAAVMGFMACQAVLTSVDYNNVNFLLKALPAEAKKGIRTFIEGMCEPAAMAVAGGLLWLATQYLSPEQISGAGLLGALACLALVLGLRGEYTRAMVHNLRRQWVEFGAGGHARAQARDLALRIADSGGVAPHLARMDEAGPRERRIAELAVAGIGLQTIPALLAVLADPSQPLRARSLAARIVGRLAPAQLESVAADLVRRELRRASQYRRAGRALAAVQPGAGLNLLYHLYREIPQAIVDFVLELHHFLGQLPAAELLAASLRSRNPQERAEALETLEQELPRAVYQGLAVHLEDARRARTRSRRELARSRATGAGFAAISARAVESADPLERAAGLTALAEQGEVEATRTALRRLLLRPGESELVRQTALAVLAGLGGSPPADSPDNPAKAVDALKREDGFADWRIEELALLVRHPSGLGPQAFLDCAQRFPRAGLRLLARGPGIAMGGRS